MNISKHAKERYAERMMGRTEKSDISVYAAQNADKIQKDIEKLVTHGTCIYDDLSTKDPNKKVSVFLKDLWVVIFDKERNTVVTLYRVDLGVGDDFDAKFVEEALNRINVATEEYNKAKAEVEETKKTYRELLEENNLQINEYRSLIKKLEDLNRSYRDIIELTSATYETKREELKQQVMVLTGRKIF